MELVVHKVDDCLAGIQASTLTSCSGNVHLNWRGKFRGKGVHIAAYIPDIKMVFVSIKGDVLIENL